MASEKSSNRSPLKEVEDELAGILDDLSPILTAKHNRTDSPEKVKGHPPKSVRTIETHLSEVNYFGSGKDENAVCVTATTNEQRIEFLKGCSRASLWHFVLQALAFPLHFENICTWTQKPWEFCVRKTGRFAERFDVFNHRNEQNSFVKISRALKSFENTYWHGRSGTFTLMKRVEGRKQVFRFIPEHDSPDVPLPAVLPLVDPFQPQTECSISADRSYFSEDPTMSITTSMSKRRKRLYDQDDNDPLYFSTSSTKQLFRENNYAEVGQMFTPSSSMSRMFPSQTFGNALWDANDSGFFSPSQNQLENWSTATSTFETQNENSPQPVSFGAEQQSVSMMNPWYKQFPHSQMTEPSSSNSACKWISDETRLPSPYFFHEYSGHPLLSPYFSDARTCNCNSPHSFNA